MTTKKAVILLSGGIDSAVCLAIAREQGYQCYALSIDYQQRNQCELRYASKIAQQQNASQHRICNLAIGSWGGSALTDKQLCLSPVDASLALPNTYVPARNTIFLATALGWAETIGAHDIFIGANALDYAHYPDCRPDYFAAFVSMANLATRDGVKGLPFQIHTPLITMDKASIIAEGKRLGINFDLTFSCYDPNEAEQACQQCSACQLRIGGFSLFGLTQNHE